MGLFAQKDLGWDRGVESKKVVQHVYLVGAKSIYRVAEKDKEYLRDEGKLFEDQYTTYKLLMLANKIVFDPEVYYYYFKTMYFIHMYFVAFCALVLYKDDYNNFKSYLICAGGALAVSEIYSWMKNISNRSTTVSRLKHD